MRTIIDTFQFLPAPPDASLIYAGAYSPAWVIISVLLAIFASYAALNASARIEHLHDNASRLAWTLISAFTLGFGIWAMHFIGMLAFSLPCGIYYDPLITLISMVPGILAGGVALGVVWHHGTKHLPPLAGSVLLGAGIGAMHYTGMAALRLDGFVRYNPSLFALSIVVAVALSYLALRVKSGMVCLNKRCTILVAVIMGAAVSGMHYTAMSAAYFVRGDVAALPSSVFTSNSLAILIAAAAVFLTMTALALAAISRNREMTDQLGLAATAFEVREGILITDAKGVILRVNRAFTSITGYAAEEVIGKNPRILNSGRHDANFYAAMWKSINDTGAWEGEIWNRRKNGEIYPEHLTISAVKGKSGIISNYVAMLSDITERKKAETAIAANRAKSDFLANMSHEIRTPMNGIIGMVDILQQTELNPAQQRMVGTIQDSSLALLHILNDILDFSKIEAGKMEVEHIPTLFREVVESTAQLMFTTADAKSIELYSFVSPQLPYWIACDPSRLRQVLLNLLGNAVKFTSSEGERCGRIELRAEPGTRDDGSAGVRLRVIDNGIGMSPETLAKLFQPFSQADESTSRKYGGTGLGLSITQRLVDLMGGRIAVHSTLGEGSEFIVELPLEEAAPARQLAPEPDLAGVRVLAVTGNAVCAGILEAYCRAQGADFSIVADLAAARWQLRQAQPSPAPQVVLLGVDITAGNEAGLPDNVGVVQLTLRGRSNRFAKAVSVFALPLLYQDLIHGVALACGRLTASDSAARTERRRYPRMRAPSIEEALVARRLILLAEDNETNREVILEQLRLLGYTAETAADGVAALGMWRTGRYNLLLTDCHMPNMDGFELTAAIRTEEPRGAHIPIIAVTANALQGEAEHCLEHGMDGYLSKPLRLDELSAMLFMWLPLPGVDAAAEATAASPDVESVSPAPGAAGLPVWNAGALTRMVGDNPDKHRRLLEKFLANAQEQAAAIRSAAAAGDAVTVCNMAHSLKSAARTVGAMQLGEQCQDMESAAKTGDGEMCRALAGHLQAAFEAASTAIKNHLVQHR